MEFLTNHIDRHQQVTVLRDALAIDYAKLQMQYAALHKEMVGYKTSANYWEAQFNKFKSREDTLKEEIEELKAKLRKREQQLFGKKSEQGASAKGQFSPSETESTSTQKRGQQIGSKGQGKRDYKHLPTVEETVELFEEDAPCVCCHLPYEELPVTEDSAILEVINVRPYQRLIRRKQYKRQCVCEKNPDPQMIVAPVSERLIPKCKFGISIWAHLLVKKFEYQQPIHRTLNELNGNGLSLAKGTVTDGFQKLLPLLTPIYDAIVERSVAAKHWHADETGWKVFETIEGKKNHRWFLWLFHKKETAVYKIERTRSSKVLIDHFGSAHEGGTLSVDRYSAYKVIAKSGLFTLAFCWAHVRRDFLQYSKEYPNNEAFGLLWVDKINHLYHLNNQRIRHETGSKEFTHHQDLKIAISAMKECAEQALKENELLPSAKKLLVSLNKHWSGLTVFMDHPEIPMDNNTAERGLRGSVVGRKNYYGSGAVWSAELTAALFTIFGTLKLWKLNVHTWLLGYFYECALLGGKPAEDVQKYLPWNMTEEQKQLFSEPPRHEDTG